MWRKTLVLFALLAAVLAQVPDLSSITSMGQNAINQLEEQVVNIANQAQQNAKTRAFLNAVARQRALQQIQQAQRNRAFLSEFKARGLGSDVTDALGQVVSHVPGVGDPLSKAIEQAGSKFDQITANSPLGRAIQQQQIQRALLNRGLFEQGSNVLGQAAEHIPGIGSQIQQAIEEAGQTADQFAGKIPFVGMRRGGVE